MTACGYWLHEHSYNEVVFSSRLVLRSHVMCFLHLPEDSYVVLDKGLASQAAGVLKARLGL